MSRQIFGYTEPLQAGPYVRLIAVTTTDNGGTLIAIRNEKGEYNSINLSPEDARDLSSAIAQSL
jgi:hypothetical protein